MSRSVKRTPMYKEANSRFGKKFASKAVRRRGCAGNGGHYKKIISGRDYICEYHIHERSFGQSFEDWKEAWETNERFRKEYPEWKRAYRR
ncbi:MAG: hypothetical protein ACI4RH_11590 [Huintestinicola sp.]